MVVPPCKTTSLGITMMFHVLFSLCTFLINWFVVFKGLLYLAVMECNTFNYF